MNENQLTNKDASTVLCSIVKHAGSGRARKKCFPLHFFPALPFPACYTTELNLVEASLFVKYHTPVLNEGPEQGKVPNFIKSKIQPCTTLIVGCFINPYKLSQLTIIEKEAITALHYIGKCKIEHYLLSDLAFEWQRDWK